MKQFKITTLYFFGLLFFMNFVALYSQVKENSAEVIKVASIFGNQMVLQQNQPIKIWGTAPSGTKIIGQLNDEKKEVVSDNEGNWMLNFSARKGSFDPLKLKINNLIFEDILVGEVWICSGQSNMEYKLKNCDTYKDNIQFTSNKNIRVFRETTIRIVAKEGYTPEELKRCNTTDFFEAKWETSTPESAAETSAVAWFFAKGLQEKLQVPLGIIQVAVGGSALNNWIPKNALQANSLTKNLFEKDWLTNKQVYLPHRQRAKAAFINVLKPDEPYLVGQTPYRWLCEPSFLFEAGIAPLKFLSFQGVLWYQGESDTENLGLVNNAQQLLLMLVNEWRNYFNNGDFPFIMIQLPGYKDPFWPEFREVQQQATNQLKNTHLVVSLDLGLENNVHPKDKQPIGERAVQSALKNVYGYTKLIGFPKLKKFTIDKQNIILKFVEIGSGLQIKNDSISGFEVADERGVFQPVKAVLNSKNTITISSPIAKPFQLRYAWMPFPNPPISIFNSEKLPLSPFQINLN